VARGKILSITLPPVGDDEDTLIANLDANRASIAQREANMIAGIVPQAYKPMVSLSAEELRAIEDRTKQFMAGDMGLADEYIKKTAFAIWQTMAAVALKDVKGRNGLNARISAAKGWFDMAKGMKALILENKQKTKPRL